jgi:putative oxygen-independent coproporphyrinogen III oxidase
MPGIGEPIALYVHWPFCLSKCPYCDFNSHVRDRIDQSRFGNALRTELAWEAARLGRRPLRSIFFGGGTPSLMDPAIVAGIIEDATRLFDVAADCEITLEANPTSVEAARLDAFRQAGVNRISIGVQSFNPEDLRRLGRQHSPGEAIAALETGRRIFPRISFDLIYARPGQTMAAWRAELRQALALAADHLSLYQLTIEPGTVYEGMHRRGELTLPDPELAAALYDATTRCRTTRCPAAKAATTSPTGAMATTPESGPAPMAASASATASSPPAAIARRSPGPTAWNATVMAAPPRRSWKAPTAPAKCF